MSELSTTKAVRPAPELSFLDPLIGWIRARKLEAPAAFILEMHRPLMPMAFPAAVMAGTLVAPFLGGPQYYEKIEALRDPAALDWMLNRLSGATVARAAGLPPHNPEDCATVAHASGLLPHNPEDCATVAHASGLLPHNPEDCATVEKGADR